MTTVLELFVPPEPESPGTRIPSTGISAVTWREFYFPTPSSLSLSRWASTTDPGQASPSFPSSQDHSTGPCWEQKDTSLKVRSMNRARSCGTRARRVRVMEVSVLPEAVGLDWAQVKKLDPKRSQSMVKKFLKQSSWWHLQFGIFFGQWQSSLYREEV